MGEGIIEATITRWFVKEGEQIDLDMPLLEVATDKVDSEIPSPASGIIHKIFFKEGEIPKVGDVLAVIFNETFQSEKAAHLPINQISVEKINKTISNQAIDKPPTQTIKVENETSQAIHRPDHVIISPYLRFLAKSREIEYDELLSIKGTGLHGRITKEDLNNYIRSGRPHARPEKLIDIPSNKEFEPVKLMPGEEIKEMDRTRKLIATHMINSKRISPHVTSMIEIDVTNVVQWRNNVKDSFYQKYSVKLTFTPLVVMAVARALKDFPGINISVTGEKIILKKYINIGVATALPDGNLIVPVIKDADKRSFANIATSLADMADRARKNKLEPAEIKGGTFTITNLGITDNITGTPIINQPEVAILAVGAIKRKPWIVVTEGMETIGIRDIMILSLTYDHRVIDGYQGGVFLKSIGNYFTSELPGF